MIAEDLPPENWESIPISLKQNAQQSNKRALACIVTCMYFLCPGLF